MFFADAPFCAMVVLPAGNPTSPASGLTSFGQAPGAADGYLIACGLIGEPVPWVMTRGGAQKKNS